MVEELGEDEAKAILLNFSCPYNTDVERFLHRTAIEFARQRLSVTYLVFASYKAELRLIGYFTLSNKIISISQKVLSNSQRKRYGKFGIYEKDLKRYLISAPLIAQLSKNYTNELNRLISGDELLKMAYDKVSEAQSLIGGRIVYLECQDTKRLVEFYTRNGFVAFGHRKLDPDEIDLIPGEYLIQMLKYLH